jgi:hypothetical protein
MWFKSTKTQTIKMERKKLFKNETDEFNHYNTQLRKILKIETDKKLRSPSAKEKEIRDLIDRVKKAPIFKAKIDLITQYLQIDRNKVDFEKILKDVAKNLDLLHGCKSFSKLSEEFEKIKISEAEFELKKADLLNLNKLIVSRIDKESSEEKIEQELIKEVQ